MKKVVFVAVIAVFFLFLSSHLEGAEKGIWKVEGFSEADLFCEEGELGFLIRNLVGKHSILVSTCLTTKKTAEVMRHLEAKDVFDLEGKVYKKTSRRPPKAIRDITSTMKRARKIVEKQEEKRKKQLQTPIPKWKEREREEFDFKPDTFRQAFLFKTLIRLDNL